MPIKKSYSYEIIDYRVIMEKINIMKYTIIYLKLIKKS